jgi:hypothetical protein
MVDSLVPFWIMTRATAWASDEVDVHGLSECFTVVFLGRDVGPGRGQLMVDNEDEGSSSHSATPTPAWHSHEWGLWRVVQPTQRVLGSG